MTDYTILIIGVVCAGIGGEIFVRGAVGLSHWARISPGIIGATVAAFATSSPELSVSIRAALSGTPQIALGDALGSNIMNVAFILGLALVISGIQTPRNTVQRDFPVALLTPGITGLLLVDGELSRIDGLLMMLMFIAWLVATCVEARRQRSVVEAVLGEHRILLIVLSSIAGLAIIPIAAIIHPIVVPWRELLMALVFGFVSLACTYPTRTGYIERRRGGIAVDTLSILSQNDFSTAGELTGTHDTCFLPIAPVISFIPTLR